MGPSPPRRLVPPLAHPPTTGTALRQRLAARLGWIGGARPVRLSGGRSAATIRLGRGPCAVVIKITRAPRTDPRHPTLDAIVTVPGDTPPPSAEPTARPVASVRASASPDTHPARPCPTTAPTAPASPLFPVDPALEGRLMAALARRGFAPAPAAMFRHGPHTCLAYRFQPGRTGHPPDAALARLLRRLHGLAPAALPPLPGPRDTAGLVARATDRLRREPDGHALLARLEAAAQAARRSAPDRCVPLHGDPVPGNVLRGPRGLRLIDWHSAHRGDPCHDLALALSPAMQLIHGLPPCTAPHRAAFLAAYGCPVSADRLAMTAALHHARMIGHCLWRLDRGDAAYGPACDAEIAALRALP